RTIQESYSQSTGLNVSENVLRAMIKDVLIEYLKTDYVKRITEDTVKTTITTLIKEGKLNVKKKVVK
ncbi:MAG: hypothetical protein GTO02_02650, partial [Candidatus Dadabacteria bacterium]|nr:hypothetical protein [Candidatus Dadabacteria bacterium]